MRINTRKKAPSGQRYLLLYSFVVTCALLFVLFQDSADCYNRTLLNVQDVTDSVAETAPVALKQFIKTYEGKLGYDDRASTTETQNNEASVAEEELAVAEAELAFVLEQDPISPVETQLEKWGFNIDWGLMEVLESSCRDIENARIPDGEDNWMKRQFTSAHPLEGFWRSPNANYIDCKVIELGCGVGVYVDSLKNHYRKRDRKVIGIETTDMGGVFKRGDQGPKQLAIDILEAPDIKALARKILKEELDNEAFDLIYSTEVFEHVPLNRHEDVVRFMASLSRKGTKLIFGAAHPHQGGYERIGGVGHIGNRPQDEWTEMMTKYGFIHYPDETAEAQKQMEDYNHRVNTRVYYFGGKR